MKFLKLILPIFLLLSFGCTNKQNFQGYKTIKSEKVDAISSEVTQLEHKKSGAQIVLIKNKDEAKTFMVGFRTPPYDDSGLFHIFEHAVLAGSRKFPSKSNFFHLANSTVASFINAMTGSVYTLYPFVTKSDEDFNNLMPAYMDAVFFPNVVNDPRIIRREGWRYEMDGDKKGLKINGIVLSEMKGAFSSPQRVLWFQLSRNMIPDTPYAFSSGGFPEKIAGLTFEQIQDAHKKYYHPQNSVIYLYGNMDFKKTLDTIDKDFLTKFEKTKDFERPAIARQKDFNYPTPVVKSTYPGQDGKDKDYLSKGYVLGDLSPIEESVAHILSQAFSENPSSPLKLRTQKEGLAKTTYYMGDSSKENVFAFTFEGSNDTSQDQIQKVLNEELDKVIAEGLNQELLESILNKYEFSFKERNSNGSHRGLQLSFRVLENWMYQDQPLSEALDLVTHFKQVRSKVSDKEYVKNFFKKHFKNNDRTRWIVLEPDPDFSKKFNAGLEKQIEEALKTKSLDEYAKEDEVYQKWVAEKESQEILAKVPTLDIKDIKGDEEPIPYAKETLGNTQLLNFAQDTNGISYISFYFDLKGVSEDQLKNLDLLTTLLKQTDAGELSFKEVSEKIDTYIGGLGFYVDTYESIKDPNQYRPTMLVTLKFLDANKDKAFELLKTVITDTKFTPEKRVDDLISELKTSMLSSVSQRAPSLSYMAAAKSFNPEKGAFIDETSGANYENYVLKSDITAEKLVPQMRKLLKDVFNQNRLYLVSSTSTESNLGNLKSSISDLKSALPAEEGKANQTWSFTNQTNYDGFAIPGEVQYVSQVTDYKNTDLNYNGSMHVYSRYLNNNYMTPRLREQAGAYGGGSAFTRYGQFTMTTYRDPNLKRSFDIFEKSVDFMDQEKLDSEKLLPAILGSLKPYYRDKSISEKTGNMTDMYLTDRTWDEYMQIKKEILSTKPSDIKKISSALKEALKNSKKSVSGNPDKIKAEAPFLKNILSLQ